MLKRIIDLPGNVLGIKASGSITASDYQSVLVPELEEKLKQFKKVRLLYELGDAFESYTSAAAWEDTKVGLKHFTQFERIAVVTDVNWIRNSMKVFGFAFPGEVRIFGNDDLQQAREWISEPAPTGDLTFEFLDEQGVLVLHPHGEIEAADFDRIANVIDPYIEKTGTLKGVMIIAENFPGWDDLGALVAHFRFIKTHRHKVKRLAIVSNDRVMSAGPYLARHIAVKESRLFSIAEKNEALAWVSQG